MQGFAPQDRTPIGYMIHLVALEDSYKLCLLKYKMEWTNEIVQELQHKFIINTLTRHHKTHNRKTYKN
jgi:hypothetical protein